MTEAASTAARRLSAQRWGSQRPIRLARELELRAAELPETERARLIEVLTETGQITRRVEEAS